MGVSRVPPPQTHPTVVMGPCFVLYYEQPSLEVKGSIPNVKKQAQSINPPQPNFRVDTMNSRLISRGNVRAAAQPWKSMPWSSLVACLVGQKVHVLTCGKSFKLLKSLDSL